MLFELQSHVLQKKDCHTEETLCHLLRELSSREELDEGRGEVQGKDGSH